MRARRPSVGCAARSPCGVCGCSRCDDQDTSAEPASAAATTESDDDDGDEDGDENHGEEAEDGSADASGSSSSPRRGGVSSRKKDAARSRTGKKQRRRSGASVSHKLSDSAADRLLEEIISKASSAGGGSAVPGAQELDDAFKQHQDAAFNLTEPQVLDQLAQYGANETAVDVARLRVWRNMGMLLQQLKEREWGKLRKSPEWATVKKDLEARKKKPSFDGWAAGKLGTNSAKVSSCVKLATMAKACPEIPFLASFLRPDSMWTDMCAKLDPLHCAIKRRR
jgi:hypothetical protein